MSTPTILSLDGLWDFFYSPKKFLPGISQLPEVKNFTGKMVTPGYWDDHYDLYDEQDFFGLTARFNPDYRKPHFPMASSLTPHAASSFLIGTGFYRKIIHPQLQQNSQAVVTVGPAMWGCALFCNRQLAGITTGYSVASHFDITPFLQQDSDNELILVVCNVHDDGGAYHRVDGSHDGEAVGARPGQHRGLAAQGYQSERAGVGGGVSLKITAESRIADWFVSSENGAPHWHATLTNAIGKRLQWTIRDNDDIVEFGSFTCGSNTIDFSTNSLAKYWHDDAPFLYTFELALFDRDTLLDQCSLRWAPRTLHIDGVKILVNDAPVYFRGVTEHCYFAETTNPHFDKDKYLHDLGILKQAGINFIRCHTWCPPEPFYDACDELGIYVQTELPSVYSFAEAEAIIRMIRRHACAVILCEGNEKILDEPAIKRLRKLVNMLHTLAPGMLFNPQEAMRGVEYAFSPEQHILTEPMAHDPERLAQIIEFTDVFGSLGGVFSYNNDDFPGAEIIDRQHSIYQRPCLSHESGILGGYLDFSLEPRYEGTFIGTDMFKAARENMQKHGVWPYHDIYYRMNCKFVASLRKQLIENLRSCSSMVGYDFLGGIDTHWHLIGYPCGIFNEFYEEKYGESIQDVRRYFDESVLLCSYGKYRNVQAGKMFDATLRLSHFGRHDIANGQIRWTFSYEDGAVIASGTNTITDCEAGAIYDVASVHFQLPDDTHAHRAVLHAVAEFNGRIRDNQWLFWVYPTADNTLPCGVRCASALTQDDVAFMANGGALLLTGGFPSATETENFRTCTSGRALGHAGTLCHPHPIWNDFPHDGYADWQFYPMMSRSHSMVFDADMPEFTPILELIPSFKLIRRKALLCEFAVGQGRLFVCGLNLPENDPAAMWLKHVILQYLSQRDFQEAPVWAPERLARRVGIVITEAQRKEIDAGGRPLD